MPRAPHLAITDNAPTAEHFRPAPAAMRLSREELLNTAGLPGDQLSELEQFGLITPRSGGLYDDDALAIAQVVAELARYGIEGRHLRAFQTAADREVGLFGQVVGPMARQRGRRRGPAPRRRSASWPRCRCDCTPRWCRSGCVTSSAEAGQTGRATGAAACASAASV